MNLVIFCSGEDMLPKYYAVEYTPPKTALLNCICCMSCFRQPFNLAIFGLDGELALRIVSGHLENCWLLRYSKECCCHQGIVKRLLIKTPDDAVIGSLVEFGHCFMTQWLQIHPGVPQTGADLADAAVVQFQSKCRCMDSLMLYCGCKTDPDTEGAMIMADKEGRKYATARPWSGITSEDSSFLFTVRFAKNCPVEMKALALAGSFIYNNLNWETRSDLTCCMLISCLFCTLRLYYDGGPVTYDYDNWSNLRTRPATAYIPWLSVNRPAVVNYRRS
ncbi:uncharacterized protein LOC118434256 [Folsomia candida]|uniref:uncharacterized protein LOC118434256 n=1 Tax=Folsomia candida TaxID=158441 RepID=UPI00160521D5|nr:uncharacterized protein LOC118434256 [Folsomia candida]